MNPVDLPRDASSPLSAHPGCNPNCRACHYKTLPYDEQIRRKNQWAKEQLGAWEPALLPIRPAPIEDRLAYRSKTWLRARFENGSVSFGMLKSKKREDGRWEKELISWDTCPLHASEIQALLPRIRARLLSTPGLRSFAKRDLEGLWFGEPHVVMVSRAPRPDAFESAAFSDLRGSAFTLFWFHRNPQVGRKIFSHHPIEPLFQASETPENPLPVATNAAPIRAFRQVARTLLLQARAQAVEHLLRSKPSAILDLYCGTGEFSELLPENVNWLGIELGTEALHQAHALKPQGRLRHQGFVGAIEQRLSDPAVLGALELERPFSLYLNPPRPGVSPEAWVPLGALLKRCRPSRVAYLSCSASSLKRDLEAFASLGYAVSSLQPYDFFPQTEHFETLALLE